MTAVREIYALSMQNTSESNTNYLKKLSEFICFCAQISDKIAKCDNANGMTAAPS